MASRGGGLYRIYTQPPIAGDRRRTVLCVGIPEFGRMNSFSRRRLIQAGGTGTVLAIAGCTSANDDVEQPDGAERSEDDAIEDEDDVDATDLAVTVVADIDDEELAEIEAEIREAQQELQEQLQEGEISEAEFEEEMQEIQIEAQEEQLEIITEAVGAIEAHVGDAAGVSVADAAAEAGVVLVDGDPGPIVDLLAVDEVAALLAEEEFDALQQPTP